MKSIVTAALGAELVLSAILGYATKLGCCYEMTFLSNATTGVILLAASLVQRRGSDIPHFLYLDITVLMATVMFVCAVFAPGACFGNASVVMHLINPLAVIAYYLVFCDGRKQPITTAFTTLVLPTLYYVFMIVYGRVTGGAVYVYFDPNRFGAIGLIVSFIIAGFAVMALTFGLLALNCVRFGVSESKTSKKATKSR